MRAYRLAFPTAAVAWAGVLFGCNVDPVDPLTRVQPQTLVQRLQHENPSVRIRAIREAGETKAPEAVPFLVDRLSDSEEDVRLFAILALEKIAGTRRGYRYFDPPARRAEAVKRWRAWLESGRPRPATTRPAGKGAP